MKHVYVKRLDEKFNGSVVDIPEPDLEQTLKLHPDWVVVGEANAEQLGLPSDTEVIHIPASDNMDQVACPICGKLAKTEHGLKVHKRVHKES